MKHESANLDLLRAIAVSFVVVSHLPHYIGWRVAGYDFDTLGRFGVAIFFVHTTLVLMQSLQRHGPSAWPFFIRRFFRIYPLSVAVVLLTTGLFLLAGKPVTWASFASNVLLIQNITGHVATPTPLWTLPYEIQMYLLLPALYAVTRTRRPVLKVAGLWLAGLAVAASGLVPLLVFAPCFLSGLLAFTLSTRRVLPAWVLFAAVALLASVIPAAVSDRAQEAPWFWLASFVLGVLIPHCREIQAGAVASAANVVARYSYGIYITHVYALSLAFTAGAGWSSWVAFVVLLAGLAGLAYHCIEAPGIRLGARLAHVQTKTTGRAVELPPPVYEGSGRSAMVDAAHDSLTSTDTPVHAP